MTEQAGPHGPDREETEEPEEAGQAVVADEPEADEPEADEPEADEPEAADEVDDEDPPPSVSRRQPSRKQWRMGAAVIVVAALVAGAFFLGRGSSTSSHHPAATNAPPGFATFHSRADGFTISYPKQWQVVTDPSLPLLLSAGGNDALSIRVLTLQQPVNTKDVASIKAVTDSILSSPSAGLQVLGARSITIGGIPGYYYLYTFPTGPPTNTVGVHAHYFLFQGRKLTMLVFQALPVGDFQRLAPIFDQVSGTFRSNPSIRPPAPAPAPATPGSTAPGSTAPGSTAPGSTAPPPTTPGSTEPATTAPASPPAT